MSDILKAPFPYFGGKSRVASQVWDALGDVDNYVEPFAGSLAVLLGRPLFGRNSARTETVNDKDSFICNAWRAIAADPEQVAFYADYPVNETDLIARHLWLVTEGIDSMIGKLESDPEFFDAKIAGWWLWGIASWIGSGWCAGNGPWVYSDDGESVVKRQRPHLGTAGQGVKRQLPHLEDAGQGVKRQLPHLGPRRGVNRQLPHLEDAGQGVNRQLPHLGDAGSPLEQYMVALQDRLRRVRVCCGDWSRVVTNGALSCGKTIGVFLDPPYSGDIREKNIYRSDDHFVSSDVAKWCVENGDKPNYRIVLAGYKEEHDHIIPDSWRRQNWKGSVSYQTTSSSKRLEDGNMKNRKSEMLWFSPNCLESTNALYV